MDWPTPCGPAALRVAWVNFGLPGASDCLPLAEERIQLAEDLWDSLPERQVQLTDVQRTELDRRRALHAADSARGRPWREVMDEIEQRQR